LGTNLGNRKQNLDRAISLIAIYTGEIKAVSGYYETEPWGFDSDMTFFNAVVQVATELSPDELLTQTQRIEKSLGRTGKSKSGVYHDRVIDIDILFYNTLIINEKHLIIPHPLLHKRVFVMQPLMEIAPELVHPVFGKNIRELFHLLQPLADGGVAGHTPVATWGQAD